MPEDVRRNEKCVYFFHLQLRSCNFFFIWYLSHGTKCAGIIAGGNNDNCGVGIAYNAKIAGKEKQNFKGGRAVCPLHSGVFK